MFDTKSDIKNRKVTISLGVTSTHVIYSSYARIR